MRRRYVSPALAMLLGAVLLLAGCLPSPLTGSSPRSAGHTSRASSTPDGPVGQSTATAGLRELFSTRLRGLAHGDVAAWLHGVSGEGLVRQQREIFRRMRALHTTDVVVTGVTQLDADTTSSDEGGRRMKVSLAYRFAGFDRTPRAFVLELIVTPAPQTASGLMVVASRPADRPQPWDLPDLHVHRSASLLVAASGSAARGDAVARLAATARPQVAAVLGAPPPAVVLVPATDEAAARLLGRQPAGLEGVSAVTDGPLEAGGSSGADRVVVVPRAWDSLSATGRQVVLTHELTHVTTRAQASGAAPLWLSEGLAEYVAYHAVRLPEGALVRPALDEVRRTGVPAQWPVDAQFTLGDGTLSAAYGLALLACRTIADRHGPAALLRFYRAAAATGSTETGFRSIGTAGSTERQAWRSRIFALLDGPSQA